MAKSDDFNRISATPALASQCERVVSGQFPPRLVWAYSVEKHGYCSVADRLIQSC
jgi:hypothetical protein